MNQKNIIIACLAVIILILAIIMWQDSNRRAQQRLENDQTNSENSETINSGNKDNPEVITPNKPVDNTNTNTDGTFNSEISNTNWTLASIYLDGKIVDMSMNVEKPMNLTFNKTEMSYSGFGGCNGFGGEYTSKTDGQFLFGPSMGTLMYCEETSPLENSYSQARDKVTNFAMKGNQLVLMSDDGKTEIVYSPAI